MSKRSTYGHIRYFPRQKTPYRLISVTVDGIRRQRFEHRLVMEEFLGRPLNNDEVVHHIDGNGLNNDPSNLEVLTQSKHQNLHLFNGPHKWSLEEAIKLRGQGKTFDYIANHFKVAPASILTAFYRRDLPTTDLRWGTNKWDVEKGISLLKEGHSLSYIAKAMDITSPSVRKAFVKRGLLPPPVPRKKSFK
jgi:hypothetical protein